MKAAGGVVCASALCAGFLALIGGVSCGGSPPRAGQGGDGKGPRVMTPPPVDETAVSERRVALVVGNANYVVGRLKNPINDARAMADALRASGFEVEMTTDADLSSMQAVLQSFGRRLSERRGSVGLFYYSGHGGQVDGRSYMIPIGAEGKVQRPADIELYCLDVDKVLKQMESASGGGENRDIGCVSEQPLSWFQPRRSFRAGGDQSAARDADCVRDGARANGKRWRRRELAVCRGIAESNAAARVGCGASIQGGAGGGEAQDAREASAVGVHIVGGGVLFLPDEQRARANGTRRGWCRSGCERAGGRARGGGVGESGRDTVGVDTTGGV